MAISKAEAREHARRIEQENMQKNMDTEIEPLQKKIADMEKHLEAE